MFERSTDKEWHNPSGTSSDSRGDLLEQSCLGVGNSKTRRTLRQQLTIISMFRLHTVERVRESVRVYEQTQKETITLPNIRQNSRNTNFWQLTDWLTDHFFSKFANFYIFKFRILMGVMSSCWIIVSSLTCPKFTVFTFPIKPIPDKIWIDFVYILTFLRWTLRTSLNFPIWLTSPLKNLSQAN